MVGLGPLLAEDGLAVNWRYRPRLCENTDKNLAQKNRRVRTRYIERSEARE